jgi:hypothetical protein
MSIVGEILQSDRSYPIATLFALEGVRGWLQGGKCDRGLINLGRVLEGMKNRTEFRPSHWTHRPEPMVAGGRFEYREPVWKIIHETASKYSPTCAMSQEECADWLANILGLAYKHRKTKELLEEFTEKLKKEKIPFVLGEEGAGAVRIVLNPAMSGENATKTLSSIVDRLVRELSARIEQMGS